eukprot:2738254-Amphidinium_carterae.1
MCHHFPQPHAGYRRALDVDIVDANICLMWEAMRQCHWQCEFHLPTPVHVRCARFYFVPMPGKNWAAHIPVYVIFGWQSLRILVGSQ